MHQLNDLGQSIWLDNISRALIRTKRLQRLIDQGLRGLTSNPTIFDKAISKSADYDRQIRDSMNRNLATFELYDEITVKDIQVAADAFRPTYDATEGLDGYVSLEINPQLAYKTEETIIEGRRLFHKVHRPNLMLKVPSTPAGFPAITALLSEGINVNVTLIFSLQHYMDTTQAYLQGVENLIAREGTAGLVRSVASVFVSRVDTLVDDLIDAGLGSQPDASQRQELEQLKGKAAVANSVLIYNKYVEIFKSERFRKLQEKGGNVQRLLWGSTSTKNPVYSDVKYVTELIGHGTINTVPEETLYAFLDHGIAKEALPGDTEDARGMFATLGRYGIDLGEVCERLLKDGVIAFQKSFVSLLGAVEEKARRLCP
jgi:transaldolase